MNQDVDAGRTPPPGRRRAVIVGTGAVAGVHAEAIAEHGDRAVVSAAVDVDAARAEAFAERHGIERWSTDLASALVDDHGPMDLAQICTPPGTHVPLAVQCLEAGVPVLIEKPPALSLAEIDALLEATERTGVQMAVVLQQRFGGAGMHAARLIAEGSRGSGIGRPLVAVCDTLWYRPDPYFAVPWRGRWEVEGGGPTIGLGVHQVDLLLALLGQWEEVSAMAARLARPTDTEDVSAAVVRFAGGALATVMNSVLSPRQTSRIRVDAERATIELEHLYGHGDESWRFTPAEGHEELADAWSAGLGGPASGHTSQIGLVLDALDDGGPLPVPLSQARDTMELVAATYASAFTGEVVRRGDVGPGHPFYERMDGGGAPWPAVKQA